MRRYCLQMALICGLGSLSESVYWRKLDGSLRIYMIRSCCVVSGLIPCRLTYCCTNIDRKLSYSLSDRQSTPAFRAFSSAYSLTSRSPRPSKASPSPS